MVIFEESWVLNLAIILATYGSIITTGYLLIQLIKRHYTGLVKLVISITIVQLVGITRAQDYLKDF